MDIKDYYKLIFDKLEKPFEFNHYVLAYGNDLRLRDIAQGRKPRNENALMVAVEPKDNLWDLTVNWGLEVFVPVVGYNSQTVLSSLDYEIYLDDVFRLYADEGSQWHYFENYIKPATEFIQSKLESYCIPYMVDFTPSGGHFLFWVRNGTIEWNELANIGCLEDDLRNAYDYFDPNDLKRNPKIQKDAGLVYNGIGRMWEYVARLAMKEVHTGAKELPLTLSDSHNKCVNLDITAYGDPAYMRIMRSPFSAHKKRAKAVQGADPLVDVILCEFNGNTRQGDMDYRQVLDCMWNNDKAIEHAQQFSGHIPVVNDNLLHLINEYKRSNLYQYHQEFDHHPDLNKQEAYYRAVNDPRLNDKTKHLLALPNPRAKNPKALIKMISNLVEVGWHPKHIGNLISDMYEQPQHHWPDDWNKYPSRTRGNFWSRIYSGLDLVNI